MGRITEKVESTPTEEILNTSSDLHEEKSAPDSIEIVENSKSPDFPSYRIHYSNSNSGKLTELNFSPKSHTFSINNAFPDYIARLEATEENYEVWEVNLYGEIEEVEISSSSRKEELAYKLENAYHSIVNQ